MTPRDAAHKTVHDYPGGSMSLAPRMDMPASTMRAKANPNDAAHGFTLDEAVQLMELTGDHRILVAMNEALCYLPPIKRVDFNVSDAALLEAYTNLMSELGDFSKEFHASLRDGKITKKEIARMREEMLEFFAAGEELLNRAEQLVE